MKNENLHFLEILQLSQTSKDYMINLTHHLNRNLAARISYKEAISVCIEHFTASELGQSVVFGAPVINGVNKFLITPDHLLLLGDEAHRQYLDRYIARYARAASNIAARGKAELN